MSGPQTPDSHIRLSSGRARGVTAADIPPELFPNIIRYVSNLKEMDWLPSRNLDTQNCLLVCMYWARECRRSLFHERTVWIHSRKQAAAFRELVVRRSSKRLTPIIDMIGEVRVLHDTKKDRPSWHHVLGSLIPLIPPHKFAELRITGYSASFRPPTPQMSSPHWGILKTLPPFMSSYREIYLVSLHFPSLPALLALLRQFPRVQKLSLSQLTWDKCIVRAPARRTRVATQRKPASLSEISVDTCRDLARLFLHLAHSGPNGGWLLRTLSNADQEAMTAVITSVSAAHHAILDRPRPCITYTQTSFGRTYMLVLVML